MMVLLVWCMGRPAHALTQPDGAQVPTRMGCNNGHPTGLAAIFACQCTSGGCNIGAACPGNQDPNSCDNGVHGTCEATIWHAWNDDTCIPTNASGLSPQTGASTTPETFQPTCALTFNLLSRGTSQFGNVFGWYNVTAHKPDVADLHVMVSCATPPGTAVVLDLASDPAYKGGEIGFFIATPESKVTHKQCAGGDCCATLPRLAQDGYVYYSQRQYNPDAAGTQSFIHLLVYDSTISPHKFYFAWEDLFAGGGNNDFTDIVTSVEGVECSGGGQACDTGQPGLCGRGVTLCTDGALGCAPLRTPTQELCDGVDQDCNGVIDDNAACPPDYVCDRGACRPNCTVSVEFACGPELVCDPVKHICVDFACDGVTCPEGKVCQNGACVGACDGIVCPHGEECFMGWCIDRCADVQCAPGQTCLEGTCFAGCNTCSGLQCSAGLVCGAGGGTCVDPSCPNGCADGTHCEAGQCVDDCAGAVCPRDQVCELGNCVPPGPGDTGDRAAAGCGCASNTGGLPGEVAPIGLALVVLVLRRRRRPASHRA